MCIRDSKHTYPASTGMVYPKAALAALVLFPIEKTSFPIASIIRSQGTFAKKKTDPRVGFSLCAQPAGRKNFTMYPCIKIYSTMTGITYLAYR